jgi:hypothetical protein
MGHRNVMVGVLVPSEGNLAQVAADTLMHYHGLCFFYKSAFSTTRRYFVDNSSDKCSSRAISLATE